MSNYYTPEKMQDKKLSDLTKDRAFLSDAITFLKSERKGYTDEEIKKKSASDVTYDILEHFRIMNTNEVSMGRDYFFVSDDNVKETDKQSYARLYSAFENAKGEGLLDNRGAKIFDYVEGVATAPSTFASVAALPLTAGTGTAAIQATKAGTLEGLKAITKNLIKRGVMASTLEGSVAASAQLGEEIIKQKAKKTIGEDYKVSKGNIALAGATGLTLGAAGYAIPARQQYKGAKRLLDTVQAGDAAKTARHAASAQRAVDDLQRHASTAEGRRYIRFTKNKLLAAIDPKLVEEGMSAKINILSKDLPDGLIGGLDRQTIQRLGAAAVELTRTIKSYNPAFKPEKGMRVTEFLANAIDQGFGVDMFDSIAGKYGLSRRQLAAVFAAEYSEAARTLVSAKQFKTSAGQVVTGKEAVEAAGKFRDKLDELYDMGMSTVSGRDAQELKDAQMQIGATRKVFRSLKNIEDTRRAFMTSQPATTMRNNIFGVAMAGIDVLDQFNLYAIQKVTGKGNAAATREGATDILKYLTKDQYVADALVYSLKEDAPELMKRAFYEAAQAEAGTIRDTKLAKLGTAVNTLNTMSDHVFKKAVVAGTVDRELKKQGSSLYKYLEEGRISEISDDIINKALDDSLAFTFQRKFGGKDASDTNKAVKKVIDLVHNTGMTTIIPFPRYMASQAKFINDYFVLNTLRRGTGQTQEAVAKQMSGAMMFAGAYMIQKDNITNGLQWFEEKLTNKDVTNAQAAMGPAAPVHYVANQLARVSMGMPNKLQDDTGLFMKDITKLMVGSEFRPGGTIVDETVRVAQSIMDGKPNFQPAAKVFGDYFSTYTYPAAVVKDFYGQFDPRSAYIPQTLDATVSLADMGGPNSPRLYLYGRFAKSLPDFNLNEMSKNLKNVTGIDLGESEMQGLLKFMGSSTRTHFQMMDPDNRDTGYDAVRHDIYGDGPLRQLNPFLKQITGFTREPPKNALKLEMARLEIDPFKIYNPYAEKNSALELFTQQLLQGKLAEDVENYITTDSIYLNSDFDVRRNLLEERIKTKIRDTRADAKTILSDFSAKREEYRSDFNAYVRGEYKALGPNQKEDAERGWSIQNKRYGFPGLTVQESAERINSDPELDADEKETRKSILMLWYIQAGKTYGKAERKAATR
jgi:phage terminase Nu1 subunit (DNA packaging protein)